MLHHFLIGRGIAVAAREREGGRHRKAAREGAALPLLQAADVEGLLRDGSVLRCWRREELHLVNCRQGALALRAVLGYPSALPKA